MYWLSGILFEDPFFQTILPTRIFLVLLFFFFTLRLIPTFLCTDWFSICLLLSVHLSREKTHVSSLCLFNFNLVLDVRVCVYALFCFLLSQQNPVRCVSKKYNKSEMPLFSQNKLQLQNIYHSLTLEKYDG